LLSPSQSLAQLIQLEGDKNMNKDRKGVFISYSWDSESHMNWVHNLTNELRGKYGVNATIDKLETQKGTVHLPKMMVENIRDKDYTIIALSRGYAQKANNFEGGVGFENELILPLLQENKDKLIFIKRDTVDFNEVLPFHFKGYYTIDFSNNDDFNEKLEELAYRIYGQPMYEAAPLGDIPNLQPKSITKDEPKQYFDNTDLLINRPITDMQKNKFLKDSFIETLKLFTSLFDQVKSMDSTFDFELEKVSTYKSIFTIYQNGNEKTKMKMWLGGQYMNGISFSYGNHIDVHNDNSLNEILRCETDSNNTLYLKMTMNLFGSEPSKPKDIVNEIWQRNIKAYLV